MKTLQIERVHLRRPELLSCRFRVRACIKTQLQVVQFNKHDKDSIAKSLRSISAALANDPLTRYLTYDADEEAARCRGVTEYAQGLLNSASAADLLFHVSDFGAAALSHRIPEELVIPPASEPTETELQDDRPAKLSVTFNDLKRKFLQDYGPYIYISMMGVRPDMQRRGLGGLLLKTICDVADKEKKWCYLEATQAGIGLYQKHGFGIISQSQLGPKAPIMQHMGRPPQ